MNTTNQGSLLLVEDNADLAETVGDFLEAKGYDVTSVTNGTDAVAEVKAISDYVSHKNGGEGCVRDIIEQVLKVRGDWPREALLLLLELLLELLLLLLLSHK